MSKLCARYAVIAVAFIACGGGGSSGDNDDPAPHGSLCPVMVCDEDGCAKLGAGDAMPVDPATGVTLEPICDIDCAYAEPPTYCAPYKVCADGACADQCVCAVR